MAGENCLYRGVVVINRLKGSQRRVQPILELAIKDGVGFLSRRHHQKW